MTISYVSPLWYHMEVNVLTMIDDYSSYMIIYLLKNKIEVLPKVQEFVQLKKQI